MSSAENIKRVRAVLEAHAPELLEFVPAPLAPRSAEGPEAMFKSVMCRLRERAARSRRDAERSGAGHRAALAWIASAPRPDAPAARLWAFVDAVTCTPGSGAELDSGEEVDAQAARCAAEGAPTWYHAAAERAFAGECACGAAAAACGESVASTVPAEVGDDVAGGDDAASTASGEV